MSAQVTEPSRIFFGPSPVGFWFAEVLDQGGKKIPAIQLLYNNERIANFLELIQAMDSQEEQPRVLVSGEDLNRVHVTVLFEHLLQSEEILQRLARHFLSIYKQRRKCGQLVALFSNCFADISREVYQRFMERFRHCGFFNLQILEPGDPDPVCRWQVRLESLEIQK